MKVKKAEPSHSSLLIPALRQEPLDFHVCPQFSSVFPNFLSYHLKGESVPVFLFQIVPPTLAFGIFRLSLPLLLLTKGSLTTSLCSGSF